MPMKIVNTGSKCPAGMKRMVKAKQKANHKAPTIFRLPYPTNPTPPKCYNRPIFHPTRKPNMNFEQARFNMVEQQIRPWDVLDFDVLDALQDIPREMFVQPEQQGYAYADLALPLPNGSQMLEPKIVGRMVQGLALKKHERVLEVGTGSGYATAVLAKLAYDVTTCDIDAQQLAAAQAILKGLQLDNIQYKAIDGLNALPADARFDAIYIGGSLKTIPQQLFSHLNDGGRIVVVVGGEPVQRCVQITRNGDAFGEKVLFDTLITPLQDGSNASWYKATGKFQF